jgi:type I restriction enzyme S subunit
MSDFFSSKISEDRLYNHLRDSTEQRAREAKDFVNQLWLRTADYVDLGFLTEASKQFHPRFWEMYLVAALLEHGFPVITRKERKFQGKGPDIQIGCVHAWIEAIAVSGGTTSEAVPELNSETKFATNVPQDKIKLRLTTAIQKKYEKYRDNYLKKGIVKQGEPFIIALNAALVPHLQIIELSVPWIVKAVFPVGHEALRFNRDSRSVLEPYHIHQDYIVKGNGIRIPTTFFQQAELKGISAILYSTAHAFGYKQLGHDFKLVHNPQASVPLPKGFLKVGTEYWIEDDQLLEQVNNK